RGNLDVRERLEIDGKALEDLLPELGVGHLASAEHDRQLHLVPLPEEPLDVALLGRVVVAVDLRAHLHLFDLHLGLLALGFLRLQAQLVAVLPVVEQPAHRWVRLRGDLDEVQVQLARDPQRVWEPHDPDPAPVRPDETNLRRPDPGVHSRVSDPTSPFLDSIEGGSRRQTGATRAPGAHRATRPGLGSPGEGLPFLCVRDGQYTPTSPRTARGRSEDASGSDRTDG